jgi:hypothetical protein
MPSLRFFIAAPSPGSLVRFLERQAARTPPAPGWFFVSDPGPPHGLRALVGPDAATPWLDGLASRLVLAFPPTLYGVLPQPDGTLLWRRWSADSPLEEGTFPAPAPPSWRARLPGYRLPQTPLQHWCQQHGLPLERADAPRMHTIDYETVSSLDQRKLLVENAPRRYRFVLPAGAVPPADEGRW